eukprot:gene9012-12154_t
MLQTFKYISVYTIAKAILTTTLFLIVREYFDQTYANPQCALRVLNETDHRAYQRHPFWKDLQYDVSLCDDMNLTAWVNHQSLGGGVLQEKQLSDLLVYIYSGLVAPALILYELYRAYKGYHVDGWKQHLLSSLWRLCTSAMFGLFSASINLMHSHYANDITYMTGVTYHHAVDKVVGISSSVIAEGYLITGLGNRLFYSVALYLIVSKSKILSAHFNPLLLVAIFQLGMHSAIRQVAAMHPVYHLMALDPSSLENALPYTTKWRAYKHCITHHDNGLSFSGDFFLDIFWDTFLYVYAFIHNQIFHLKVSSYGHYLLCTISDAVMGLMGVGVMYLCLRVLALFTPKYQKMHSA